MSRKNHGRTRKELEEENEDLWTVLEEIYDRLSEYFEPEETPVEATVLEIVKPADKPPMLPQPPKDAA